MNCKYCGIYFEGKSLGGHTIHCKDNPNKVTNFNSKGRLHSDDTKRKISEIRKEFLKNNPNKVPYLLNHRYKETYPETYFKEVLPNFIHQYKIPETLYVADFANPIEKYIIEIDGEQHYLDNKIVEHDIKRTNILESLDWKITRIRWSVFQKLTFNEKYDIISKLNEYQIIDKSLLSNEEHKCIDCGKIIHKKSVRCISCNNEIKNISQYRFNITKEELEELVKTHSMTKIGKLYNVSSNAIKNRCIKLNIEYKKPTKKS